MRHVYSNQQPYNGDTAIIEVATRKILVPLAANQVLWELKLVWSDDSQRVAYYDETIQARPPRVFFRSGSSFNEIALPELLPPKLPPSAAGGDPETKARIEPMQWLKSGDLLLESELQNPAWGRAALKITLGFDGVNHCFVRQAEQAKVSIVDYFLLLPENQFEGPPSVWLRHARTDGQAYLCEARPLEQRVDEKNGYIKCGGDGAQPNFEVALFRYRDGRPLLALCYGEAPELEGPDSVSLEFFEMGDDGKMQEIKRSIFPSLTATTIVGNSCYRDKVGRLSCARRRAKKFCTNSRGTEKGFRKKNNSSNARGAAGKTYSSFFCSLTGRVLTIRDLSPGKSSHSPSASNQT